MTLEILSDFFLFISTNQKQINDNDLQSFEYFISKQFSIINSQNQHPVISKELNEEKHKNSKMKKRIILSGLLGFILGAFVVGCSNK